MHRGKFATFEIESGEDGTGSREGLIFFVWEFKEGEKKGKNLSMRGILVE